MANSIIDPKTLPWLRSTTSCHQLTGLNQFYTILERDMPEPQRDKSSVDEDDAWAGGFSYAGALDVFKHHPSRVRKFTEKDAHLTGGDASGIEVLHDVTGDTLDIARFMDGEPECFASLTNGVPRAKRVRILLDIAASAGVSPDDLALRGRRLTRLVDWLESQQIRCMVSIVISNTCHHLEITVKDFHEPLDLNDIAVASHPSFFRRLWFRMAEYSPTWKAGYGQPDHLAGHIQLHPDTIRSTDPNETTIYIGTYFGGDIEQKFNHLESTLQERLSDDLTDNKTLSVLN